MTWQAHFPTRVFFGRGVINEQADLLHTLGSRALIVTGKGGSAIRNGALEDVCRTLEKTSLGWELFNEVEPNPTIETVRRGAALAREMRADFVIGIGGGSPMDAAKAIAITNLAEVSDEELFNLQYGDVLPIVLIPTTAGTGSEVTPASILTSHKDQTKRNIGSAKLIPNIAFLDSSYTSGLPWQITADTAVDAYSHAIESYLSAKNNAISSLFSEQAMTILSQELRVIARKNDLGPDNRDSLLYASYLAGVAISLTGTSIPHALGYSLTYYKGMPHGRANGVIMPSWMDFNHKMSQSDRITMALKLSSLASLDDFRELMELLCGKAPACTVDEQNIFLKHALNTKNINNNIVIPRPEDIAEILANCLS
ncbi:MAG: iron-containing alcohol dehydrogenase family protein [Syntrophomonadaceae bacterium]|nr:iron-containing alcohol dehydrogenase family protein [Syntrophomonadaceae bacterium]